MSVQFFGTRDSDGPASFVSLGVQVGGDWSIDLCSYDDRPPILTLDVGRLHLTVSPLASEITPGHLEFAHALLAAAGEYLIECDRIDLERRDRETGDQTPPLAA